jgi:CRISPR-associated endonuclease/helicase Cas3
LHEAVCYIIGLDGDAFMDGTTQIYEKYLLLRTKALLPSCLTIPCDVPKLVQEVYDESTNPSPEPAGYREAQEAWKKNILDKEKRAGDFRVSQPWPGPEANLVGWRDTDESIEVLLIQEKNDGTLRFLPWIEDGHELLPNTTPDDKLAKALACQRIRLPRVLCAPWAIGRTIEELERLNVEYLSQWQQSPWLKGELFLILGDNGSATLCGYRLSYNQENGLLCEKEDGV